jgi:hypothetical protein
VLNPNYPDTIPNQPNKILLGDPKAWMLMTHKKNHQLIIKE